MKGKSHTPEQVVKKLSEGDQMLNDGSSVAEVARHFGVAEGTWYRWKATYGGMKGGDMKRLKELEKENRRLRRIVTNQALDIDMLKELAEGNF